MPLQKRTPKLIRTARRLQQGAVSMVMFPVLFGYALLLIFLLAGSQSAPQIRVGNFDLGDVVAAENLDSDGCAVNITDTYDSLDDFYIVMEDNAIPTGTSIFVRLYHESIAVEDTDEIMAEVDYANVCVNFVFDSTEGWDSGAYEAEFFVNGKAYRSVSFTVQ
jgi:hypothetical protein